MTKFKVGDRVKSKTSGREATVIELNPDDDGEVKIQFDRESRPVWYGALWLEKIK